MSSITVDGKLIELNEYGFLARPDEWSEHVAEALAMLDGIPVLTEAHWRVISYLREYYRRFGIAPMIRKLSKETGVTMKELEILFPSAPLKEACKLAGLAKPNGCL
jgi:tRNA 2-thiouridine synthesizing protein E